MELYPPINGLVTRVITLLVGVITPWRTGSRAHLVGNNYFCELCPSWPSSHSFIWSQILIFQRGYWNEDPGNDHMSNQTGGGYLQAYLGISRTMMYVVLPSEAFPQWRLELKIYTLSILIPQNWLFWGHLTLRNTGSITLECWRVQKITDPPPKMSSIKYTFFLKIQTSRHTWILRVWDAIFRLRKWILTLTSQFKGSLWTSVIQSNVVGAWTR